MYLLVRIPGFAIEGKGVYGREIAIEQGGIKYELISLKCLLLP